MIEKRSGQNRHHNRQHHKKVSHHPYRSTSSGRFSGSSSSSSINRVVSVNEALKTDRILSIESFANVERLKDTEEIVTEYGKYVRKHQKAHLRNIFNLHKKEKWISNLKNSETSTTNNSVDKESFNSINWTPEINLKYEEEFGMKLEESSNEGGTFSSNSGTETRLLDAASEMIPESFSKLLPEFSSQIITMSNIPPYVSKEALEGHLNELAPESEIEITFPNADKSFYRLAWMKLKENSSEKITEIVPKLESLGSIEGAKIYFGIASSNFRRFKVTKYLEGSEDELFNLAIKFIKLFESEETSSYDGIDSLDKAVVYLRKVHKFCFYCVNKFSCFQEMTQKCGDLHLRAPNSEFDSVKHDQHRFIEKISAMIEFMSNLHRVSSENELDLDETLTETSIKKEEEGKFRCVHCSKAFKGPEFVLKHLQLKHEDIVSQTQTDLNDFATFLSNARMWLFPSTMIPRYTKIRSKMNGNTSGSRDSHGSSRSSISRGSRGSKEYTDWDATASNFNSSTEINYDL